MSAALRASVLQEPAGASERAMWEVWLLQPVLSSMFLLCQMGSVAREIILEYIVI